MGEQMLNKMFISLVSNISIMIRSNNNQYSTGRIQRSSPPLEKLSPPHLSMKMRIDRIAVCSAGMLLIDACM